MNGGALARRFANPRRKRQFPSGCRHFICCSRTLPVEANSDFQGAPSRKSAGRPPISQEVAELIIQFAKENPRAGYDRIQGMLENLGHEVSDTTVKNVLKQHGIEPAPTRAKQTTWTDFLRSHVQTMAACDFFTTEVWTAGGLVTFYSLFVIETATRRVEVAGITTSPDSA